MHPLINHKTKVNSFARKLSFHLQKKINVFMMSLRCIIHNLYECREGKLEHIFYDDVLFSFLLYKVSSSFASSATVQVIISLKSISMETTRRERVKNNSEKVLIVNSLNVVS